MNAAQGQAARAATAAQHTEPLAQTRSGQVRGIVKDGISVFKGIPYAASTASANRFRAPQPVAPWSGVRDALAYPNMAPQPPAPRAACSPPGPIRRASARIASASASGRRACATAASVR
ncbi:MAG: carboxylesterase family protein [Xanthobacteraceae bacterium]